MDRLERVRQQVDGILRQQRDAEESRCGFVHLYGVAAVSALLALKRGLDPELCSVAGMLHDISSYKTGDPEDHARLSAREADRILGELGGFADEERRIIGSAITHHSDKDALHDPMDELLKDADVLQHYLYNTSLPVAPSRRRRLSAVLSEFIRRPTIAELKAIADAGPSEPGALVGERAARLCTGGRVPGRPGWPLTTAGTAG